MTEREAEVEGEREKREDKTPNGCQKETREREMDGGMDRERESVKTEVGCVKQTAEERMSQCP